MQLIHRNLPNNLLNRDLNHLVDTFLGSAPSTPRSGSWEPALDVMENETEYRLLVELPGLTKEDVKIEFTDNILTLKGEKKSITEVDGDHWHRRESRTGSFERRLELPLAVDADRIQARFRDGVLSVTIPKAEEARPREINIEF